MIKAIVITVTILISLGYAAYPMISPILSQSTARVYSVELGSVISFGSDPDVHANITAVGEISVTQLQVARMESKPPVYAYLRIASKASTVYVAVFWQSAPDGTQTASFERVAVPVSSLTEPAQFFYQGFTGKEISLGAY